MKDFRDGLRDGDQGLYVEVNAAVDAMSGEYLRKLSSTITTEKYVLVLETGEASKKKKI